MDELWFRTNYGKGQIQFVQIFQVKFWYNLLYYLPTVSTLCLEAFVVEQRGQGISERVEVEILFLKGKPQFESREILARKFVRIDRMAGNGSSFQRKQRKKRC